MKKRQSVRVSNSSLQSLYRSHRGSFIFLVFALVALVIVAAYTSNPALFAGMQGFAKAPAKSAYDLRQETRQAAKEAAKKSGKKDSAGCNDGAGGGCPTGSKCMYTGTDPNTGKRIGYCSQVTPPNTQGKTFDQVARGWKGSSCFFNWQCVTNGLSNGGIVGDPGQQGYVSGDNYAPGAPVSGYYVAPNGLYYPVGK